MPTYGVTPTGFYAKPLSVIQSEVDAGLKSILGESAGTESDGTIPLDSMAGQLKTLLVDMISAQWDVQEAIYSSLDPAGAVGAALDSIASISGSVRGSARQSTVWIVTLSSNSAVVMPAGRVVSDGANRLFVSQEDIYFHDFEAYGVSGSYAKGAVVIGDSGTRLYVATIGGDTSSTEPTGTGTAISDGEVTWYYLAEFTNQSSWGETLDGNINTWVAAEAGAIGAVAGTLTTIETPVSSWVLAVNPEDAEVGRDRESDAAFRARRAEELAAPGNTTVDAIRANILKVNEGSTDPDHEQPSDCIVFFNDTDGYDSNGLPPHSIEVLVRDGTTEDIAQAIWDSVGAGTRTYGTRNDSVTDSEGNTQTVYWSRPTEIPIYVTLTARYNAAEWPSGTTDAEVEEHIISALLTATEDYPLARDVRTSPLNAAVMRGPAEVDGNGSAVVPASAGSDPIPGMLEVESIFIGTSASPATSTQISIARREYAAFSSARLTITATSEEP